MKHCLYTSRITKDTYLKLLKLQSTELANRGRPLTEEVLIVLREKIEIAQEEQRKLDAEIHGDITDDPNAPLLYTPAGVYGYAFFFGHFSVRFFTVLISGELIKEAGSFRL